MYCMTKNYMASGAENGGYFQPLKTIKVTIIRSGVSYLKTNPG